MSELASYASRIDNSIKKHRDQLDLLTKDSSQHKLQLAVAATKNEMKALETTIKDHKTEIEATQKAVAGLQTDATKDRQDLRRANDACSALNQRVHTQGTKLEQLESTIREAQQDLNTLKARFESHVHAMQSINTDLSSKISSIDTRLITLSSELNANSSTCRSDVNNVRFELRDLLDNHSRELNNATARSQDEFRAHNERIRDLEYVTTQTDQRLRRTRQYIRRSETCCVML